MIPKAPLYRNALFLALSSWAGAGLEFAFWILVARNFPPPEVGVGSALISATALLSFAGSLGVDFGIIRFLPGAKEQKSFLNTFLTLAGLCSGAAAFVFAFGTDVWSPKLSFLRDPPYLLGFVPTVVIATVGGAVDRTFIALRRAEFLLWVVLIFGALKLGIIGAMRGLGAFGILACYGLAGAVGLSISLLLFLPKLIPGFRPSPLLRAGMSEALRFSFANYAGQFLLNLPGWILPLMILELVGAEGNAYFWTSWRAAGLLYSITAAVSFSLFAEGSYEERSFGRELRRSFKFLGFFLLPATAAFILLGREILLAFGGEYSARGFELFRILCLAALPQALASLHLTAARVERKLRMILLISAGISLPTLALSSLLLPHLGIKGAGIAWLSSNLLISLPLLPSLLWKFGLSPPRRGGRQKRSRGR